MDLKSIINNEATNAQTSTTHSVENKAPTNSSTSTPTQSQHSAHAHAQNLYREYSQPVQSRQPSVDCAPQQQQYATETKAVLASPTLYQGYSNQQRQLQAQRTPTGSERGDGELRSPIDKEREYRKSYPGPISQLQPPSQGGQYHNTPSHYLTASSSASPGPGQQHSQYTQQQQRDSYPQQVYPPPSAGYQQRGHGSVPSTSPISTSSLTPTGYPQHPQHQTPNLYHASTSVSQHSALSTPNSAHSQPHITYSRVDHSPHLYPTTPYQREREAHSQPPPQRDLRSLPGTPLGPPFAVPDVSRVNTYPQPQHQSSSYEGLQKERERLSVSSSQGQGQQIRSHLSSPYPPQRPDLDRQASSGSYPPQRPDLDRQASSGQTSGRSFSSHPSPQIENLRAPEQQYRPQQPQPPYQPHPDYAQRPDQHQPYPEPQHHSVQRSASEIERQRQREQSASVSPKTVPLQRRESSEIRRQQQQQQAVAPQPQRQVGKIPAPPQPEQSKPPQPQQQREMSPHRADYEMEDRSLKRKASDADSPSAKRQKEMTLAANTSRRRKPYRPLRDPKAEAYIPIWARSWPQHVRKLQQLERAGGRQQQAPQQVNGMPQAAPQPAAQNTVAGQPGAGAAEAAAGPISIPWAPSLGPSVPVADITKSIADFLFIHVISRPDSNSLASTGIDIEIEAKLGLLIEKDTNQRVRLPVRSECVLDMPGRVRFENGLDVVANEQRQAGEAVFRELNTVLNSWVEDSNKPVQDGRVPITYVHRREVDSFHLLDSSALRSFHPSMQSLLDTPQTRNRGIKVRVSRDQKTGREIARIVKARVADLDLWMPNSPLDVRLSVNLEMRFEGDLPMDFGVAPNEDDGGERRKDRLGYRQSGYTVDLTQVTNSAGQRSHELEVELDTNLLIDQGQRLKEGREHAFDAVIEGLVNNVHILCREVGGVLGA